LIVSTNTYFVFNEHSNFNTDFNQSDFEKTPKVRKCLNMSVQRDLLILEAKVDIKRLGIFPEKVFDVLKPFCF